MITLPRKLFGYSICTYSDECLAGYTAAIFKGRRLVAAVDRREHMGYMAVLLIGPDIGPYMTAEDAIAGAIGEMGRIKH